MLNKNILIILSLVSIAIGQYSNAGPFDINITSQNIFVTDSLPMSYSIFSPLNNEPDVIVLLSHGFSRDRNSLEDLAEHYASWCIVAITMDLLHSSIVDNDPIIDAIDMNILASEVGEGRSVIYLGHSAGALRSVIAASQNSNAIAILGFELVDVLDSGSDSESLALSYVSDISIPVWGLIGESSPCNAYGNGLSVFQEANNGNAISITEADHCDFEFPTNFLCTILCEGTNDSFLDDEIQDVIINLSTAFLLYYTENDDLAIQLWEPGNNYYDSLIDGGAIQQIISLDTYKSAPVSNNFKLYNNYPNPFNPITNIKYKILNSGNVNIVISDINGINIKSLVNKFHNQGNYLLQWNGSDWQGITLPSGVYFYTIKAGEYMHTEKMILLK